MKSDIPVEDVFANSSEVKDYDLKRNGKKLNKTDIPYVYRLVDGTGFVCRLYHKKTKTDTFIMYDPKVRANGLKKPFPSKKSASEYLFSQIELLDNDSTYKNKKITFSEVWDMFLSSQHNRANETIRRYNSIFNHHVKEVFGNRVINDISAVDYNEYFIKMYRIGDGNGNKLNGYSFQYVQSILKFIFLVVNYAYQKHIITTDNFVRFKEELKMPSKLKSVDNKKIRVLTDEQIKQIDALLKNTDFYLQFLISLTGGLRPAETFALCFEDVDFDKCIIHVNKQIVEEADGRRVIKHTKTDKSNRSVDIPLDVANAIKRRYRALEEARAFNPILFEQNKSKFIDARNYKDEVIEQLNFISVDLKGRYVNAHSFSYYTKIIKKEICISSEEYEDFSFYTFRKTHLSQMAANNCPVGELMKRAGHSKMETIYEYYYNTTDTAHDMLKNAMYKSSSILFKK